ncbi:hypothetical protein [Gemmiger formicilis]|uniref:hypothetical protein n=1 Tax=Gemmiger formicilis TaxID=745368 RepID=UPI001D0EADAE|nr:hypothetical protein [Gemmiger formicilis]MCC2194313.1 hypothetical protein [Gemmiger formicilis]
MQGKLIASYRRELSALDDLQCAGTVTYTLTQEADAFVITVQRDGARAAACMLCEIEEERGDADPFPVRKRRGACAYLRGTA